MALPWLVMLAISAAVSVVSYLLMPKAKTPRPEASKQSEAPTADAGKPIPVVFGTIRVKELNCLGWYDQSMNSYEVKV